MIGHTHLRRHAAPHAAIDVTRSTPFAAVAFKPPVLPPSAELATISSVATMDSAHISDDKGYSRDDNEYSSDDDGYSSDEDYEDEEDQAIASRSQGQPQNPYGTTVIRRHRAHQQRTREQTKRTGLVSLNLSKGYGVPSGWKTQDGFRELIQNLYNTNLAAFFPQFFRAAS